MLPTLVVLSLHRHGQREAQRPPPDANPFSQASLAGSTSARASRPACVVFTIHRHTTGGSATQASAKVAGRALLLLAARRPPTLDATLPGGSPRPRARTRLRPRQNDVLHVPERRVEAAEERLRLDLELDVVARRERRRDDAGLGGELRGRAAMRLDERASAGGRRDATPATAGCRRRA